MTNRKVFDLAIMAMFLAIILILTLTPLGYPPIPFLPIGPTIIHIPVLVACIYFGVKKGSLVGFFFGVSSWYVALTRGATPIDYVFRNPLVSILPRVLFAVIAAYLYQWAKKRMNDKVAIGVSVALSTLLHTFLVLFMLALVGRGAIIDFLGLTDVSSLRVLMILVQANILLNTLPEIILAVIIVLPIIHAIQTTTKKSTNSNSNHTNGFEIDEN